MQRSSLKKELAVIASVCALAIIFLVYHLFIGPFRFKVPVNDKLGGVLIEVEPGMGSRALANELKASGIISSASLFSGLASVLGDSKHVVAGYYLFKKPTGVVQAESRFRTGDFGLEQVKITFPEGFSKRQVEERLAAALPFFDSSAFEAIASTSEGYLFPDTYFFLPSDSEETIFNKMRSVFDERTKDLGFATSSRSEKDVITMASILEKEVRSPKDMQIVSGILWKRIEMKIALQVDATLAYERGLTSAQLTLADLKLDSPYNTYTYRGLPPTPIDNPGLNAMYAALYPASSPYLYFLTDSEGNVHYAKTFEEHKANKAKYL